MRFFISIVLGVALFACTKGGGNIYVEGRVYNPVTGEGIPNAEIILFKSKVSGAPLQSGSSKEIKRAYTDNDGYYVIKHTGGLNQYSLTYSSMDQNGKVYYAIGFGENNMGVEEGQYGTRMGVEKGKNMYVDYLMVPFGEYKFDIENTNCQGGNDNIKIIYEGAQIDDEPNRVGDIIINLDGCIDIPGDIWIEHPMGNRYYRWEVNKNGITQIYYDTIYIAPGEQRVYEAFY